VHPIDRQHVRQDKVFAQINMQVRGYKRKENEKPGVTSKKDDYKERKIKRNCQD